MTLPIGPQVLRPVTTLLRRQRGAALIARPRAFSGHFAARVDEVGRLVFETPTLHLLTKNTTTSRRSFRRSSRTQACRVFEVGELLEDALNINIGPLVRHRIEAIKEFDAIHPISLDKQKVMQILINLIGNAKHSKRDAETDEGQICLSIRRQDHSIVLQVMDNGVGIRPVNLEKSFRHGFTTKSDGHGFGLHRAAIAAKEMGGSLTVKSDGAGKDATFTLRLPLKLQGVVA
ncbi:MAG: ATP-binding protein [Planctomycetaceae bacterium]|nr:ATP-binding protein [Planctomycetales bacterium]MCB9922674.1 ATP-binding protein [Planctomycetaceae bacterium]